MNTKQQSLPQRRLGDLCQMVFQGMSLSRQATGTMEYPAILIRDLQNGRVNPEGLVKAAVTEMALNDYGVRKGDVLVSAKGTIGKTALVDRDNAWVISSNLIALRPKRDVIDPAYLYAYLSSDHASRQMDSMIRPSVTVKSVSASDLQDLLVPLPDVETQERLGRLALAHDEYQVLAGQCLVAAKRVLNEVLITRIAGKGGKMMRR